MMRLGLSLPTFTDDVDRPVAAARRAAELGFDGVFSVDHLFPPGFPERPSLEAFATLSAIAVSNPGLGVGLLVARAGVRPVGLLAKQAAALDQLSGGRAILGLGAGDALVRAEHETLGLPFPNAEERVALLEETAHAARSLFAGKPWSGGDRVPAIEGPLLPSGRPDVWVGGTSDRVVRAAARAANAWNGWNLDADGFAARAAALAEAATQAGRDPAEVVPTWGGIVLVGEDEHDLAAVSEARDAVGPAWDAWRGTAGELRAFADQLREHGCAWFVCAVAGSDDRAEIIAQALGER
jgi:alkanesulfonate monooxygenase SsuD/methylene tetrahydromethanopterin reductase-like flavin-dependent oxidoreductase (luciferase family)